MIVKIGAFSLKKIVQFSCVVIKIIYFSFVYNITSKDGCAICLKKFCNSVVIIYMVRKNITGLIFKVCTGKVRTVVATGQIAGCNFGMNVII